MSESQSKPVRTFISYSWSSPTHEQWVIDLATRLIEDGVDVILDKWDLKPGHDANHFMETMVNDPEVSKVLMVCDKVYVEKANARAGGVGTESQIISPKIYGDVRQDKFAAIITEGDEAGEAYRPHFYTGRIYFDFRSEARVEEAYEQVLRWLVDRPLHVKPKLGKVPAEILDVQPAASGIQSAAKRVVQAVKEGKPAATGLLREFAAGLIRELRALRPAYAHGLESDEVVLAAIAAMRPYLRQFLEIVRTVVLYGEGDRFWEQILSILEQLGSLMYRDPDTQLSASCQFDPSIIIAHEAFLSIVALALDEQRFDLAAKVFERGYLVRENEGGNRPSISDFTVFRQYPRSLDARQRQLNRISLQADLIRDAHPAGSVPSFESLMQADFVTYIRADDGNPHHGWYPVTLVYAARSFTPMPLFARAESCGFLQKLLPVLDKADETSCVTEIKRIAESPRSGSLFDHDGLPVSYLANEKHLASRP